MSHPRPIHQPPRDLRHSPDEAEPSYSYEQDSFLSKVEDDVEDEFHRRLNQHRGSFWRTSQDGIQPSFSSMSMKQRSDSSPGLDVAATRIGGDRRSLSGGEVGVVSPSIGMLGGSWANPEATITGRESSTSSREMSATGRESKKKDFSKQRITARRMKLESQLSDLDLGHLEEEDSPPPLLIPPMEGSLSRSSSSDCSSSLLYGKTLHAPRNGVLLGKSSSLIFPTGVEAPENDESESSKRRKINLMLDQCETARFPFKKKLILENLRLVPSDIPLKDLIGTSLGNSLHKLSLSGNRLTVIPAKLVQSLPTLKHLDLSQCDLVQLPEKWNLPQLKRLNLSHNRILEFPDEAILEGLPELQELNMYGNKVSEIIIPRSNKLLSKLETLNLGYNELAFLPDELDQLKSLRTLKVMSNYLVKIPMRVCDMDIRAIDVSANPLMQPPIDTCERGICSMRRYYHCLRLEEQTKHKALEEVQKKLVKQKKKDEKNKFRKLFFSGKSPTCSFNKISVDDAGASASPNASLSVREPQAAFKEEIVEVEVLTPKVGHEEQPASPQIVHEPKSAQVVFDEVIDDVILSEAPTAPDDEVTVNDTLKVIFVGMALAGKTSMIKRLIEGKDAVIPKRDERTVGVDIYEWDPKDTTDTHIEVEDLDVAKTCGDVNVKFSVWDFAGQHVYHATHELFFSPRALYVLVWDMGATNRATQRRKFSMDNEQGAFKLSYDSSDDEDEDNFVAEEETRRADRALERDIDEKVQFWVDCIQSSAPGAAILPVASFDDYFESEGNKEEAERRCHVMKQRLLKHEERRIEGIQERLKEYYNENRANDEGALRLRKLLCPYTRPKLILGGDDENSVVRVSGTKYTGFDSLTERIVNIATGRDKAGFLYPIFRGHVGARIPRMRLEVREAVRDMRDRFKVVEWGYFLSALRERGLYSVEDISDALHFLTNIGELSYFGNVFPDRQKISDKMINAEKHSSGSLDRACQGMEHHRDPVDDDDDDDDEEKAILSIDDTSITASSSLDDGSISTVEDLTSAGLSQFVFLNPRWLVAAVACILRHDLDREIRDTRRSMSKVDGVIDRADSFYEANLNCPIITAEDACMLWQARRFTKKAAERAQEYSNNMAVTPFDFLQRLLVRFGVFVPIDLSIDKAFLGGKEYAKNIGNCDDGSPDKVEFVLSLEGALDTPQFFFLPSLLGPGEPSEAWTYKNTDSWKITLCHSILFPDGVPPGLMERITASVLSSIYTVANHPGVNGANGKTHANFEGQLRVKEILCWRTAFFIKLGMEVGSEQGEIKESVVEIFTHLVDRDSHLCVGSDSMGAGMRRLVLSAKGQVGDGGRKIWTGGYSLVLKAIGRVMNEYGGLEFEKQGFCPECLSKKAVSQASAWDWTVIRIAAQNGDDTMRCHHGHRVDTRLITGPCEAAVRPKMEHGNQPKYTDSDLIVPVNDLLRGVVVVGLWDGKARKLVRVGSGFIVDKKRGLIVTASHTLMNIWGDTNTPFGENYYGLREGKVVIGVIPRNNGTENGGETRAVFRYFAKIVAKDPSIDGKGECHSDACVLRITTKMENDVGGNGEGCGDEPETLLVNNPEALKREKLQQLKVTEKCELDEPVRILGYNQGGEGLLGPGESLSRYVDFARGYVCKKFATGEESGGYMRHRFKPREEIVVICPTIGGHSGGPCVNQQGEVIGILSRADPAENHRCYLVPASEWKALVKKAKNTF